MPVAPAPAASGRVELPDPRSAPGTPPAVAMESTGSPPGPPAQAPPGYNDRLPDLPERPSRTNDLAKKTPAEVADFERKANVKVVENDDNLFVYDTVVDGQRLRIALLEERTKSGFPVIGMAFLDDQKIRAVEEAKKSNKHTSLLGPGVAHAHETNYGHYHGFFGCSYAYQYANSWQLYVYICPADVSSARAVGGSIAGAIGIATGHPWLGWAVGLGINSGMWWLQEDDGSIHVYFDAESVLRNFGWVYYWGKLQTWMYGYARDAAYNAFGWVQSWRDSSWWRIAF